MIQGGGRTAGPQRASVRGQEGRRGGVERRMPCARLGGMAYRGRRRSGGPVCKACADVCDKGRVMGGRKVASTGWRRGCYGGGAWGRKSGVGTWERGKSQPRKAHLPPCRAVRTRYLPSYLVLRPGRCTGKWACPPSTTTTRHRYDNRVEWLLLRVGLPATRTRGSRRRTPCDSSRPLQNRAELDVVTCLPRSVGHATPRRCIKDGAAYL